MAETIDLLTQHLASVTVSCGVAVSFRMPLSEVSPVSVVLSRTLFFCSMRSTSCNHFWFLFIEKTNHRKKFRFVLFVFRIYSYLCKLET